MIIGMIRVIAHLTEVLDEPYGYPSTEVEIVHCSHLNSHSFALDGSGDLLTQELLNGGPEIFIDSILDEFQKAQINDCDTFIEIVGEAHGEYFDSPTMNGVEQDAYFWLENCKTYVLSDKEAQNVMERYCGGDKEV